MKSANMLAISIVAVFVAGPLLAEECNPPSLPPGVSTDTEFAEGNPHNLAVSVYLPFSQVLGHIDSDGCQDGAEWGGRWAFDLWVDDEISTYGVPTCGAGVYLNLEPSARTGLTAPEEIYLLVVQRGTGTLACPNREEVEPSGYQQAYEIYGKLGNEIYCLGWVLYAHLDELIHQNGTWLNPGQYVGNLSEGDSNTNPIPDCWASCHLHFEAKSYNGGSSCYEVCQGQASNVPSSGPIAEIGNWQPTYTVLDGDLVTNPVNNCLVHNSEILENHDGTVVPEAIDGCDARVISIVLENTGDAIWLKDEVWLMPSGNNQLTWKVDDSSGTQDIFVSIGNANKAPGETVTVEFEVLSPRGMERCSLQRNLSAQLARVIDVDGDNTVEVQPFGETETWILNIAPDDTCPDQPWMCSTDTLDQCDILDVKRTCTRRCSKGCTSVHQRINVIDPQCLPEVDCSGGSWVRETTKGYCTPKDRWTRQCHAGSVSVTEEACEDWRPEECPNP